jgi:hypothetical protein
MRRQARLSPLEVSYIQCPYFVIISFLGFDSQFHMNASLTSSVYNHNVTNPSRPLWFYCAEAITIDYCKNGQEFNRFCQSWCEMTFGNTGMLYVVNPHRQSMGALLSRLLHEVFSIRDLEKDAPTLGSHVPEVLDDVPTEVGSFSQTLIIPTLSSSPVNPMASNSPTGNSRSHTGLTAGLAVGALIIVALLLGGLWYYLQKRRFTKAEAEPGPLDANQTAYASKNVPAAIQLPYPQQEHTSNIAIDGTNWDVNGQSKSINGAKQHSDSLQVPRCPFAFPTPPVSSHNEPSSSAAAVSTSLYFPTSPSQEQPPIYAPASSSTNLQSSGFLPLNGISLEHLEDSGQETRQVTDRDIIIGQFCKENQNVIDKETEKALRRAGYLPHIDPDVVSQAEWERAGVGIVTLAMLRNIYRKRK